jgi:hypothetical protein
MEAGVPEDDHAGADADAEVDGWPVLSDLDLEVCVADTAAPGLTTAAGRGENA